ALFQILVTNWTFIEPSPTAISDFCLRFPSCRAGYFQGDNGFAGLLRINSSLAIPNVAIPIFDGPIQDRLVLSGRRQSYSTIGAESRGGQPIGDEIGD